MRMLTPASASIATHTAQKMIVLPKSGCFISRKAMAPVSTAEIGNTGSDLSLSRRLSSQAMRDDEEGLQKLRRLDLAKPELDPAAGAIMLGADRSGRRPAARRRRPRRTGEGAARARAASSR